ncbi:MAG: peptide chain release factor N(5)-glutamine methyltransferase [Bacteroidota bacterium]
MPKIILKLKVNQIKTHFFNELKSFYPKTEIDSFFFWLLEDLASINRTQFLMHPSTEVSPKSKEKFDDALNRLKDQEPIQHILGYTEFFGRKFEVNANTLIPRPETENLIDWIVNDYNNQDFSTSSPSILDIGTGSGCIPITLAKEITGAQVQAIDVSEAALQMAQQNAKINQAKVDFILADVLELEKLPILADIIVSNPPYVRESEKAEINQNVLEFEPELALFVTDSDPFIFYKKIAYLASIQQHPTQVYFEVNEYLAKETQAAVAVFKPAISELKKDIFGKDRMLKLVFN